jgi:hypothetical protein
MKWLLFVLVSSQALAMSPVRDPRVPFEVYEAEAQLDSEKIWGSSAMNKAIRYVNRADLARPVRWTPEQLDTAFKMIRDDRFLTWQRRADFPRRASWLFPADGCYIRAGLANQYLDRKKIPAASKIFAFGDLLVNTPYYVTGRASWWYHVAQVVDVNGVNMVLDPAVEAKRALTMDEWLARMGDPNKMKVSICGQGAYLPKSRCKDTAIFGISPELLNKTLDQEWDNLADLKFDPDTLLGEAPPWAATSASSAR